MVNLRQDLFERAREIGGYIVSENATVRAAAGKFGISKSTVFKDVSERLYAADRLLYEQCKSVLERNKAERHIRGGEATRKKYERTR